MRSALLLLLCAGAFAATPDKHIPTVPVQFEQNLNQWSARGLGYAFRFEKNGTAMRLGDRTLRMKFEGSNASAPFTGLDRSPNPTNVFRGQEYRQIDNYARLRRTGVYRGIDLLYYSHNGELEFDFEIAPGADPSLVALRFEGADSVRLNDAGDLILSLAGKELTQRAPTVYQRRDTGEMVTVAGSYRIEKDGAVRFHLGDYDRSAALVIDPAIVYAQFIGGSFGDIGVALAHDAQGFIYIGGTTFSSDFPVGGIGFSQAAIGDEDCFLIKIDPTPPDPSQAIAYSSYYGGTSDDILTAMKVNATGQILFTGNTSSVDFPVSTGAYATSLSPSAVVTGGTHGFVVELDSTQNSSNSQIYSTYFGGSTNSAGTASSDSGQGIFVTANGMIYVTGYTTSLDFPLSGALQGSSGGSYDVFISEFNPVQGGPASLIFSSYFGGVAQDWGNDIAVDSKGLIYLTGFTYSSNFPYTASTAYANYQGQGDAFLSIINAGSGTVVYSTFFGGADGFDQGNRLLVDPTGTTVAIAGLTLSPFLPVTQNAYQAVMPALTNIDSSGFQAASNGFLAIFNMAQAKGAHQGLTYATYLGGFGGEDIYGLRSDAENNYYLSGYTMSQNFPVTANAFNTTSAGGGLDGFITVLNPTAPTINGQLVFSSYITSPGTQTVNDVDVDAQGTIWMTGVATSGIFPPGYATFPTAPYSPPGYPVSELGKQSAFLWGFTLAQPSEFDILRGATSRTLHRSNPSRK